MHRPIILLFLLLVASVSFGQRYSLQYIDTHTDASFRGLSVAGDSAIWVSGSKGWVGRTTNGGRDWAFAQVPGYAHCDFRTLYAFDANNAIIANAGSPAYILRTSNGGTSWTLVYELKDSATFIDGAAFWNTKHGIMHGDPIDGRMLLLSTHNGGKTWKEHSKRQRPELNRGEASFAASGTAISCYSRHRVIVATGGTTSRLLLSRSRGRHWRSIPTPMLAGRASTGTYTVMPGRSAGHWLIAGGDYLRDTLKTANCFYTHNTGRHWLAPATTTRGYRECMAMIDDGRPAKRSRTRTMFAIGPSGIDISADDGVNWKPLSDEKGFHVMKPAHDQNRIFLAGSSGKLAIMSTVNNEQ